MVTQGSNSGPAPGTGTHAHTVVVVEVCVRATVFTCRVERLSVIAEISGPCM